MTTFAQKYAQLDKDLFSLLLVGAIYIVIIIAKGLKKRPDKAKKASSTPQRRPAGRRPSHAASSTPPEAPKAAPTPFLSGNDGFDPMAEPTFAADENAPAPAAPRRRPMLPGGTDPRAAMIWGEVLRRRF